MTREKIEVEARADDDRAGRVDTRWLHALAARAAAGSIDFAHAGSTNKDYNERGIGVCLVGNFEKSPPTAAQRRSVKLLVATLKAEYKIPTASVVGHKDIRASSTECPGKFFPMAEVAAGEPA